MNVPGWNLPFTCLCLPCNSYKISLYWFLQQLETVLCEVRTESLYTAYCLLLRCTTLKYVMLGAFSHVFISSKVRVKIKNIFVGLRPVLCFEGQLILLRHTQFSIVFYLIILRETQFSIVFYLILLRETQFSIVFCLITAVEKLLMPELLQNEHLRCCWVESDRVMVFTENVFFLQAPYRDQKLPPPTLPKAKTNFCVAVSRWLLLFSITTLQNPH
jgi:hypothetical protein